MLIQFTNRAIGIRKKTLFTANVLRSNFNLSGTVFTAVLFVALSGCVSNSKKVQGPAANSTPTTNSTKDVVSNSTNPQQRLRDIAHAKTQKLPVSKNNAAPNRRTLIVNTEPAPRHEKDRYPDQEVDFSDAQEPNPRMEPRSQYGNHSPYQVLGKKYQVLERAEGYKEQGLASWYGVKFHGRLTSSREPYDMYAFTAAHKTLPLPAYARVTNLDNGISVIVRVNDRGPFHAGRIIDLSYAAANKLGILARGTGRVEVEAITTFDDTSPINASALTYTAPPTGKAAEPSDADTNQIIAVTETAAEKPEDRGLVVVQAGSFETHNNAKQLRKKLHAMDLGRVFIDELKRAGPNLYRVQIGPFSSNEVAAQILLSLRAAGLRGVIVDAK